MSLPHALPLRHLRWPTLFALVASGLVLPQGGGVAQAASTSAFVTYVADGDTFDVDRDGDGVTDARVRLIGVDTPESGECGYQDATNELQALIGGRQVRLHSDVDDATGHNDRLLRRVTVDRDGTTIDATAYLLHKGLGFWMSDGVQLTSMDRYRQLATDAALAGRGIFAGDRCTAGPAAGVGLQLDVQWKSDPNAGEHARITNLGSVDVDLSGWTLRSGGIRTETIPSGPAIAAGRTLTVYAGEGTSTHYVRYLGNTKMFPDIDPLDPFGGHPGDGAYLVDPQGDVRAWQIYPCVSGCTSPAAGRVEITRVSYDPPGKDNDDLNGEWFDVTNTSDQKVGVGRLVLEAHPYTVELPPTLQLAPGESIRVHSGSGTDDHTKRYYYLDSTYPVLHNDGDTVLVRTYHSAVIDCSSWGTGSCPSGGPPKIAAAPPPDEVSAGTPITGDFDGNGTTDVGWFSDGQVALRLSASRVIRFNYGRAGDIPVVGDWNADGVDTLGIIRDGTWHLIDSHRSGSSDLSFVYGRIGSRGEDVPLVGDWDGNGRTDPGIVRDGEWHLRKKLSGGPGQIVFTYGRVGPRGDDIPLIGDWNANGRDSIGIVRDGEWHLRNQLSAGPGQIVFNYGRVTEGDIPITGDWNRDGGTTAGIVRGATWYLRDANSSGPAHTTISFGG